MESMPIYGATVIESKSKPELDLSKNAFAYMLAVFPISPRFASAIVKHSFGIISSVFLRLSIPFAPLDS